MNPSLEPYFSMEKLDHKISRERIGIEVQKMAFAASSDPVLCFSYLVNFGLFHVVFKLPPTLRESNTEHLFQFGTYQLFRCSGEKSRELLKDREIPQEALAALRRAAGSFPFLPAPMLSFRFDP
jgi:hypothetical protein